MAAAAARTTTTIIVLSSRLNHWNLFEFNSKNMSKEESLANVEKHLYALKYAKQLYSESVGSYREKLAATLMMIDHVAIVTDNLARARKFYARLGLKVTRVYNVTEQFQEEHRPHRYRAVEILFPEGGPVLWVMQPVGRTGPLRRFLKRRGPGLHHLGLWVKRMEHDYPRLRSAGIRFIRHATKFETEIRAIINPQESQGVLIELVERLPKTKRR